MNGKYFVIFFNRSDNSHMAEPFSVFAANCPFLLIKRVQDLFVQTKQIFFSRRQDTPYQPEYCQVFILQKLGFRLYIIFIYSFLHPCPSRLYVTNLAASGVTSPLVGLKPIVGVVHDSNSRHNQLGYFQTTFVKCTSSSLR